MTQKLKFFIAFCIMLSFCVVVGIGASHSHNVIGWIACGYFLHEAKDMLIAFINE